MLLQTKQQKVKQSDWAIMPFPDAIDFQEGPGILARDFRVAGVPLIRLSGLTRGASVLDGCNHLDAEMVKRRWSHFELQAGDILLSTSASLGRIAIVTPDAAGAVAYTGIIRMRPRSPSVRAGFIPYLLEGKEFQNQAEGMGAGSVIRHFGPMHLKKMSLTIPPPQIQESIVRIMSAYDELIENSQRRIKILESMARALYREWFVHFRFPGHESVPRVPSPLGEIPQGWEVKRLKDVCRLTMGQSPKSEFYNEDGNGVVFHQGVTDFGDRFPSDRLFCTADGRMAEPGDILFSVRAPVGRMNIANKQIMLGRGLSAIRHQNGYQAFLWEQLRNRFTKDDMMGNGSIFASVTKEDMQGIDLVCPRNPIVEDATTHFEPLHTELATLSQQIQNLRRTRDLLLPRLLSGQIDMETIS